MGRRAARWIDTALATRVAAVWLGLAVALAGAAAADPLFDGSEPLAVSLTVDLRALEAQADEDTSHEAQLRWLGADGEVLSVPVKVRPRGHSRRRLCDFPPLRLNLPRQALADTVFAEQDKLKLVTHCASMGKHSRYARAYLALEYLAYRLLNGLTDVSFRVRALQITYVDARSGREHRHAAFAIEHKRRLAERLGLTLAAQDSIPKAALHPEATQRVELFQYMIGNTDFSIVAGEPGEQCCHNAIALRQDDRYLPVPYDFDMSGLVNKPEAKPARNLGLSGVRQRLYRGYCREEHYLKQTVAEYLTARSALMAQLDEVAELFELPKAARMTAAKYIDDFYAQVLLRPAQLERQITGRCRE